MNAIELLKKNHREILDLIHELEVIDGVAADLRRKDVFDNLEASFDFYAAVKEQVFYPEIKKAGETKHSIERSKTGRRRIEEILSKMKRESGDWENNLSELKESVRDYVKKEETEVFPQVEQILGDKKLKEIGEKIEKTVKDSLSIV